MINAPCFPSGGSSNRTPSIPRCAGIFRTATLTTPIARGMSDVPGVASQLPTRGKLVRQRITGNSLASTFNTAKSKSLVVATSSAE